MRELKGIERPNAQQKKPKILILGPPREIVSGISTHLNQIFESDLSAEFSLRHLITGSAHREESSRRKISRLFADYLRFFVTLIRERPDIVHINVTFDHKSFPRDAVFLAVSRALAVPVVFQAHGGELPDDLYRGRKLLTRLVHGVLRGASVVVLLGKTQLASFSQSVPSARFRVIPNAIDVGSVLDRPVRDTSRALNLVFAGRLAEEKGVADCLRAARLLKDSGRDFTLKIAGVGPEEARLKELARSLDLNSNVEFLGSLFGDEMKELWRDSDVFVFPTYTLEGLPYALLESMAAGTVPITTRVGAQPEVIEDGVQGLFIPAKDPEALRDAIVRLDDDRAKLARLSRAATKRVRGYYTVDRLAGDFRNLYFSLLR